MTSPRPYDLRAVDGSSNEWQPSARTEALSRRLVAAPSETGTVDEAGFGDILAEVLREIPYFQANPQDLHLLDSHGTPAAQNVVAIVRGKGERALILAGHYDTVATDNYHDLKALSCDADPLRAALIADLSSRPCTAQEAQALDDLRSGQFLPGRGMLDMKSGIAAGIAVLERFAADPDRAGNLILTVSPDEERESRGMRALRNDLPGLLSRCGLRAAGAINMDVTSDQGDGSVGRAIYTGTIGKLMPFALVVGQSSHASYPFEGVSAQLIASSILQAIEANPNLADQDDADISPPPICLEMRDLRNAYEVTTPERVWLAFNWLYHAMTPAELLSRFGAELEMAALSAHRTLAGRAADYAQKTGAAAGAAPAVPEVITCADLQILAQQQMGTAFAEAFAEQQDRVSGIDNPLVMSRMLVEWLWDAARLSGPKVVIGFASLHYPRTGLDPADPADAALHEAIRRAVAPLEADPARKLQWRPHFQGISDMSFFGQPAATRSEAVVANTPALRLIDAPADDAIRCPMVNIGPWGREFHQRLERVYTPYAFDDLPRIIAAIADHFFHDDRRTEAKVEV